MIFQSRPKLWLSRKAVSPNSSPSTAEVQVHNGQVHPRIWVTEIQWAEGKNQDRIGIIVFFVEDRYRLLNNYV